MSEPTTNKFLGGGIVVAILMVLATCMVLLSRGPAEPKRPSPSVMRATPREPSLNNPQSNIAAQARNFGVRKAVLTPLEKQELAAKFETEIKTAAQNWQRAYAGHTSIHLDQLTLENFKEKIGRDTAFTIYTFMLDGATICFRDSGGRVVVNYINTPNAKQLNQLPAGAPSTLAIPITQQEIIRMVKQDSGTEFQPKEVHLRPTGAATAMSGGAFVDIAPLRGDPNNALCKLSLVFGPDGDVAYYCRDPSL